MEQHLRRFLPRRIGSTLALQRVYHFPRDLIEGLLGNRNPMVPPRGIVFTGSGDFEEVGRKFLRYFVDLGGLAPAHRVLDVGCGIGRMAVPLTGYLRPPGAYEGFDIVSAGITWCRRRITPCFPNFRFRVADINNAAYNPGGSHTPDAYRFSYPNAAFDFTFLTSVFTHLLPPAVDNYLSEVARTLKPGGRALITFCLLNPQSRACIESGSSNLDFRHTHGCCRIVDSRAPEAAVAYDEAYVRSLYLAYGLDIAEPIHYGSWCGRRDFLDYQDIVIAVKRR